MSHNPTNETYLVLSTWYDLMNDYFFGGQLPRPLITMQRQRNAKGYFSASRFVERTERGVVRLTQYLEGDKVHEIAINPECLDRPDAEVASTLLHEMVHLWQQEYGKPPKGAYHNKEWAGKMKEVGLLPRSLDRPGQETGRRCTHEIEPNGPFAEFFEQSLSHYQLPYADLTIKAVRDTSRNKIKYTCECGTAVWGKPGLAIGCLECNSPFEER